MAKIPKMKEEDIRPKHLVEEGKRLRIKELQELMERKNEFEQVPCPACESNNYQLVFEKEGFSFVKCQKCQTMFINPRPTFEILLNFYETSESIKHWNKKIFPVSEDFRRKEIFIPRTKKVVELSRKYNTATEVLLDVGAGFGTFCQEIKKLAVFQKVIAVEPSPGLAESCRQKGLETIEEPIQKVDLKEVNVITAFELIEHLYSPKDFLLSCAEILSKKGILILTTPNIKGFDLLTLGKLSDNIAGPSHLNYFHPDSLSYLLEHCGFKVIEVETPGKLDAELVRKKIMNNEFNISNRPFLKEVLIKQWEKVGNAFQKFLADNLLSSHLWIVAQKQL